MQHVIVISENDFTDSPTLDFKELVKAADSELEPAHTIRDDSAFWLFCSGSTGNPKGGIYLQHDMEHALDSYAKNVLKISEHDITFFRVQAVLRLWTCNGMYFPLGIGTSTVLMSERPTPERVFETIDKYKPTIFFGVPTLYGAIIDLAERSGRRYDLSSVRICDLPVKLSSSRVY